MSPGVYLRWLPFWLPTSGRRKVIGLHICSLVVMVAERQNLPAAEDDRPVSPLWDRHPMTYFRARNVPQFGTISTRPSSARRRSALITVFRATP